MSCIRMFATATLAAAAACAEPVVEMQILMPSNADMFDASCVTGVSVFAMGNNFANDDSDVAGSCIEITPADRLTGVRDAIRGKLALSIPPSGLSGVEIMGWGGASTCENEFGGDLVFHAATPYIGQEQIDLKLDTTMDCTKQQVKVRPVELFTLISGANPSAATCSAALFPADDADAWTSLGQIRERALGTGVDFFGGMRGSALTSGVASFQAPTSGLSGSCLAYDTWGRFGGATGCTIGGGKVCAGADEIEAPFIDADIANSVASLDEALLSKWDSIVFVSVWNSTATKKPIAGATLEVAAADGVVVYVDPPAAGSTQLVRRSDASTGTSGLALVYTNKLANVKVNAGGSSRNITVASPARWGYGAALVVMP